MALTTNIQYASSGTVRCTSAVRSRTWTSPGTSSWPRGCTHRMRTTDMTRMMKITVMRINLTHYIYGKIHNCTISKYVFPVRLLIYTKLDKFISVKIYIFLHWAGGYLWKDVFLDNVILEFDRLDVELLINKTWIIV